MSIEVFNISIEQETEHEILRYNKFFQTLKGVNKYLTIKWCEWFLDDEDNLDKISINSRKDKDSGEIENKDEKTSEKSSVCSSDISDLSDEEEKWDIPDKQIISVETLKNIVDNNKINETRSVKILEYGEGNVAKYAIVVRLNKIIINE